MPTSEATLSAGADSIAYAAALDAFRAAHVTLTGREGLVQAYRAVQALPYFSGPERTPQAALRDGRGACTAKHLLLRDLLRRMGWTADVEIVEGDFASGIPTHPSMPPALVRMIGQRGVRDFHCRLRVDAPKGGQLLDATWPLYLIGWGFPADERWQGLGDTAQAIAQVDLRARVEDVITTKARLLATLSAEETQRRLDFLALLSGWLADIPPPATA